MSTSFFIQNYSCQLADFQGRPVWVAWRSEPRPNKAGEIKTTKVPYRSNNRKADSNDPSSWITLDEAGRVAGATGGGVGLVLGIEADDGIHVGGIDLDSCRDGVAVEPWAREIIERFESYAEISPSGSGAKVFFLYRKADLQRLQNEALGQNKYGKKVAARTGKAHPPAIEVYLKGRYFAVTAKSDGYPERLRLVSFDDLNWLISDAMVRFTEASDAKDAIALGPSSATMPNSHGTTRVAGQRGARCWRHVIGAGVSAIRR